MWITQTLVDFMICVLATCFITSTKAQGDASCDFEKGVCGWVQGQNDGFDWTRNRGATETWFTGPNADHTTGDGYYIYIETNNKRHGEKARLTSPHVDGGHYCITFWYIMYGKDTNTLNVYMETNHKDEQLMFSRKGNQGKLWYQAHVSVDSNATFQIAIEGVSGDGNNGDIAVDDILLKSGWCSDCNFDDGLCEWTQDADDDFDWIEGEYETTSDSTGPLTDHTSTNGSYIYIETSVNNNEDSARITSPQMDPGQPCFTFWYSMYGRDVNALNVYMKINGNLGTPILALENNTGSSDWRQAHISITSSHDYQIVIEGVTGASYRGDIAIDDIVMNTDLCAADTVTTEATQTPSISTVLTSHDMLSTTAITVHNDLPATENEGGSLAAVYVAIPVLVIIVASVVVVMIYRRRREKDRPAFGYIGSVQPNPPPPVVIYDRYDSHVLNQHAATTLHLDLPGLDDNVYAEIDLDYLRPIASHASNTDYNTVEQIETPEHNYEQMTKGTASVDDTPHSPIDKCPDEKKSGTIGNTYLNIRN